MTMVNVAGRSKSCSTCRKRRVKCDETHPVCKRCLKAGLDCDGPRGTAFVQTVFVSSSDSPETHVKLQSSQVIRHTSSLTPSPSPSLSSDNDERFICYARKYFRRGASVDVAMDSIRRSPANATDRSVAVRDFEQTVLCFSTIMFGVDHGQTAIRSNGYTQHGLTLAKLNHALSDPEYRTSDEVLLTIVVLALLEGLEPTSPGSYLSHMLALEKLLAMRDATAGLPTSTVRICQGCRHMLVFASLRTRRATILSQGPWKLILRQDCGEDYLREQDLFDVLADCSTLLERRDRLSMLECTEAEKNILQHALFREALSQLEFLSLLSQRRYAETTDEAWLTIGHQQLGLLSEWTQPTAPDETFIPISESTATELLLYHTALIWAYRLLGDIVGKDTSIQRAEMPYYASDPLMPDGASCFAAEKLAAEAVCSCALKSLMTGLSRHLNSSPIIHWAVTTAWETVGPDSEFSRQMFNQVLRASSGPNIAKGLLLGPPQPTNS